MNVLSLFYMTYQVCKEQQSIKDKSLIELDKEKTERDAYFKNFHEEMINMMNIFEDKYQLLFQIYQSSLPGIKGFLVGL